jgi:hypothetical protein
VARIVVAPGDQLGVAVGELADAGSDHLPGFTSSLFDDAVVHARSQIRSRSASLIAIGDDNSPSSSSSSQPSPF